MNKDLRFVLNSLEEWDRPFFSNSKHGFEEFCELFPSKYRDHPEIKVYYKTLRKRFAVCQEDVKDNIEASYQKKPDEDEDSLGRTEVEKAIVLLEHINQHLSEESTDLKNENEKMKSTLISTAPDILLTFNKELRPAVAAFQAIDNRIYPRL